MPHPDQLSRPRRSEMAQALGLLATSSHLSQDSNCGEAKTSLLIDLTMDDNENEVVLTSPTTPRSKSLMSALSRDTRALTEDDERPPPKTSNSSKPDQNVRRKSILSVDFSSPLGVLVLESIKRQSKRSFLNSSVTPCHNYDDYCKAPSKSSVEQGGRLRDRKEQVTFKKKGKRFKQKWAHEYKFTRAQRIEWYRTSVAGVNKKGRKLKRQMNKCHLSVTRLSDATLKKWETRHSFDLDWLKVMTPDQAKRLLENHGQTLTNLAAMATALRHKASVFIAWREIVDEITRLRELRGLPQPVLVVNRVSNECLTPPQRKTLQRYQDLERSSSNSRHVVSGAGDQNKTSSLSASALPKFDKEQTARSGASKLRGPKRVNAHRDSSNSVQSSGGASDTSTARNRRSEKKPQKPKAHATADTTESSDVLRPNGARSNVAMKSTSARKRKGKRDNVVADNDVESSISLSSRETTESDDVTVTGESRCPPGKRRKLNDDFVPLPVPKSYRFHCQQCNQVVYDATDMESLVKRHYRIKHGIDGVRLEQRRTTDGEMRIDILLDSQARSKTSNNNNKKSSQNSVICID